MHPEMSLVILTVFSTAGQGIFIFLVVMNSIVPESLSGSYIITAALASILFQFIGMGASFFHLGNPMKGWKAIMMWRNSWLSREVISLSAFVGAASLYLIIYITEMNKSILDIVGYAGIIMSIGFLIASSMVYASIGYIKEWANAFTPATFISLGLTCGAAFALAGFYLSCHHSEIYPKINLLLIAMTIFSFILKAMAYRFNANVYTSLSVSNAIGINDKHIKLMDRGTPYAHYNTKEYFHPITEDQSSIQKNLIMIVTFLIPLLIWMLIGLLLNINSHGAAFLAISGACVMLLGLLMERRFFFIQGNHFQNLYYGNYKKSSIDNPLVR